MIACDRCAGKVTGTERITLNSFRVGADHACVDVCRACMLDFFRWAGLQPPAAPYVTK